jgi:hypothetical protein
MLFFATSTTQRSRRVSRGAVARTASLSKRLARFHQAKLLGAPEDVSGHASALPVNFSAGDGRAGNREPSSGGQPFPPLDPPPFEDQSTALGAHPFAKTVDLGAFSQSRLKCSFHNGAPPTGSIESLSYQGVVMPGVTRARLSMRSPRNAECIPDRLPSQGLCAAD